MHKQELKFVFEGNVTDNFDKEIIRNFYWTTKAKSAKQAVSNINFAAKKSCNLVVDTHLFLYGTLTCESFLKYKVEKNKLQIPYNEDIDTYTYELSTGALKLNKTANLPYYANLFEFFDKNDFSREQFVWKLEQLKSSKPLIKKVSKEQFQQLNINNFNRSGSDTLEDDETFWVWDDEEGVYWKNGIKFGDYLTTLED